MNDRFQENRSVSLLAIDQYRRAVAWIETEPLTEQEETELLQRLRFGKVELSKDLPDSQLLDEALQARDHLIEAYQPLVLKVARRYVHYTESMDLLDLVQEGNMGLMRALDQDNFPLENWTGFLYEKVRYAILSALQDRDGMVRLPKNKDVALRKLYRARAAVAESIGHHPTSAQVASYMHLSEQEIVQLSQWERCRSVASLSAVLHEPDAEGWVRLWSLYEDHAHSGTRTGQSWQHCFPILAHALETVLSPRQQQVIRLRYGFEGGEGDHFGQRKVAQLLGVLESSVYKSERAAKEKLRQALEPVIALGGAR